MGDRFWSGAVIILLGWGALALGATRPWGYLPLLAGMATFGAATFLKPAKPGLIARGLCFSLVTLCCAVFIQLIPLPAGLLSAISPATASMTALQTSSIAAHARVDRWAFSHPLSIDPSATALGLACMMALGLFFVGTVRTMRPSGAHQLALGLVGLGTIVALLGIAEASGLWRGVYAAAGLPLPPDSRPLGPFSSKNHYAGWMLMTLSLTMGYLCAALEHSGLLSHARPRRQVRPSWSVRAGRMLVVQCAATAMAVAIVETRSRGGILCLALAIATLGGLLMRRCASVRTRVLMVSPFVVLLLTGIIVTGVQPIANRFVDASWSTAHGRLPIWRQAIAIAEDFPITGSGLNTYQTIVPFYSSADHDPYEGAHNDFLQLAAEGGLLLGLPALATVGLFAWETRKRFRESSSDSVTNWLRIGAVLGLLLIAVEEIVDFSLQVPGNAALFVVLAAIAVHRAPARRSIVDEMRGNEFA